jgi:hypothetical protein
METVQKFETPSLEKMWEYLRESAERHKEFEKEMKESAERHKEYQKESEKSKAEFNERLGNYINLFGDFTEYTMTPKMREKFFDLGLDFQKTVRRVSVRDNKNDIFFEVDAMLENGDTAMLVEIKTELTVDRIKKHIVRMEKMRKYSDLRGDKRVFLGAVAGVIMDEETRTYALDQGFYLIEPAGQDLSITLPNGKPKEW